MRSLLDGLIGVCLAVALGACSERSEPHASSADAARPNLLVIVADDLGYGDLGCYGAPHAITPHLDALAADGVRFEHFYVASPMCSSSRASLLTGRYPGRHGLTQALVGDDPDAGLDPREVLLPERLRDVGYATGLVGKWHLGLRPEHHPLARGFDEFFGMLAASSGYYEHAYRGTPDLWRGREAVTSERYSTELFSDDVDDEFSLCPIFTSPPPATYSRSVYVEELVVVATGETEGEVMSTNVKETLREGNKLVYRLG